MFDRSTDRRAILAGTAVATLALLGAGCTSSEASAAPLARTDAEWRRRLGPERYRILRQAGTERPFTSPLLKEKRKGVFACAGCDLPLFASETKFDSGTGWPSFYAPIEGAVESGKDWSFGLLREDAHCRRRGGHPGPFFAQAPTPAGPRP